jgi:hypothetical protein
MGKNDNETWRDRLDTLVLEAARGLRQRGLVEFNEEDGGTLSSTQFGETMSKVCLHRLWKNSLISLQLYVRQATVRLLL